MSAKTTGAIWDIKISVPWRMVLLAMADHADHDGEQMHASQAFIAWKTGYSSRNVARIVQEMIAAQLLILTDEGIGVENEYRIDLTAAQMKPAFHGRRPKKRTDTHAKMSGDTHAKMSGDTHANMSGVGDDLRLTHAKMSPPHAKMSGGTHDILAIDSKSTIVGGVGVGGESLTRELIERGLNPTSAEMITQSGGDDATILQSLDNMLADGRIARRDRDKVLGNFMRRWKAAPPPDGAPYARQNGTDAASTAPPPPPAPRAVLTPQERIERGKQYDPFNKKAALHDPS